jgi:putative peptidoglycan lipid II flippase
MAELYNLDDIAGLKRTAVRALGIIWTLTIPAGAALLLLGQPAIALMFQGGEFDEASTRLVYTVLAVFSLRVISEATLEIVARLFYAQHNTRTPMVAYLGWLLVNVVVAFSLVGPLGIVGLALASTVAFTALSAALFLLNRRRLGDLDERRLAASSGRALAATAGMAATIWLLGRLIQSRFIYLGAALAGGFLVYLLLNLVLGGREIPDLIQLVRPGMFAPKGSNKCS